MYPEKSSTEVFIMRKSRKSRSRKSRKSRSRRSNPRRSRRRAKRRAPRARRSNPRRRRRSNPRRRRRSNPVFRRRSVKRRRRNPGLSLKSAFNKAFILNALLTVGGFVAGIKGTKYLLMIPGLAGVNRFIGIVHLLLGGIVAAKAKNGKAKAIGAGMAAAGVFDLVAKNVTALGLPTLLGMDDEVSGDYMGETYLPGQTQVLGDELLGETYIPGQTEVLSEDFAGSDVYADY